MSKTRSVLNFAQGLKFKTDSYSKYVNRRWGLKNLSPLSPGNSYAGVGETVLFSQNSYTAHPWTNTFWSGYTSDGKI